MLRHLEEKFPAEEFPQLRVGLANADDAAVYELSDDQAIVQTLDFFAPLVDDPYEFGAIAAANAMSDVYAMGGRVLFALNIAAFPEDLPQKIVAAILSGGADKVREAGGAIAGGHTVIDAEPKYGLSVTGLVHPQRILTNSGARPGDVVLVTKRIGTGALIGAIQDQAVDEADARTAIDQMMALNRAAAEAAATVDVHAMADVTGFGVGGHLQEIAENSEVGIRLSLSTLPALPGFAAAVAAGFSNAGHARNRDYFLPRLIGERDLSALEDALLYDPQTSGGLLISLPEEDAEQLSRKLDNEGVGVARIAEVREAGGAPGVEPRD